MNTNHKVIEVDGYFMVKMNDGSFYKSYSTDEVRTVKDGYYAARIASRKFAEEMVTFLVRFFDENGTVRAEPLQQEENSKTVESEVEEVAANLVIEHKGSYVVKLSNGKYFGGYTTGRENVLLQADDKEMALQFRKESAARQVAKTIQERFGSSFSKGFEAK